MQKADWTYVSTQAGGGISNWVSSDEEPLMKKFVLRSILGLVGLASLVTAAAGPKPKRLAVGTLAAAATVKEAWLFDADRVDEIPAGFIGYVGDWRGVADDTAPSGDKVLAQRAKSSSAIFNVALLDDMALQDVDISVHYGV